MSKVMADKTFSNATELIKQLREQTGAGIMECKKALEQAGGDLEQAERIIRSQGKQFAGE